MAAAPSDTKLPFSEQNGGESIAMTTAPSQSAGATDSVAAAATPSPPAAEQQSIPAEYGPTKEVPLVGEHQGYPVNPQMIPNPDGSNGVTPLHLLGEQPQWIDCPFCYQRTKTLINSEGTAMQAVAGVLCCLFCVCLACVPCIAHWCENKEYRCSNCKNVVAFRPYDSPLQTFGPGSNNQGQVPSKFPPAGQAAVVGGNAATATPADAPAGEATRSTQVAGQVGNDPSVPPPAYDGPAKSS